VVLPACGGLLTSEQPARQNYLLQPLGATGGGFEGSQNATLRLGLGVIPGLDTDRIQALDPDARLIPYANARWPDRLPEVLASVLQRSLETTGQFAQVASGGRAAGTEWVLDLELRAFYGIRNSAGSTESVRIALAGTLACGDGTYRLNLTDSAPVAEERLAAVVAAHQAALNAVTRDLIGQLGERCRATVDSSP
jgi:ABC-type uncharacterized transport system auxiliary subunit